MRTAVPSLPLVFSTLLSFSIAGTLTCCTGTKKNAPKTRIEHRSVLLQTTTVSAPSRPLPQTLSFTELNHLSKGNSPTPATQQKIHRLFSSPSIHNSPSHTPKRLTLSNNTHLGDFIRVASWNIEKSLHVPRIIEILTSEEAFIRQLKPAVLKNPATFQEALRQRNRLTSADVLLLQEMDVGMPRSGYTHAARDIAKALGMNYSYTPQQLEIDPVSLGLEGTLPSPDPKRYQGLFGIAVLSRFPILSATAFQLKNQPYDWFKDEQKPISIIEKMRRLAATFLVHSQFQRELKYGGRVFFRVDLHVPPLPSKRLTIIHNHLEIKTTTRGREAQLNEILDYIRPIPNAVVMAGDHNSAHTDVSATSLSRVVSRASKDPQTWLDTAANLSAVVPDGITLARSLANSLKNLHNPLATHIPFIFPNQTRRLFKTIEHYRFDDGGQFDTRGDRVRSINGQSSAFANSNERYWKGLDPTYRVPRPIGPFGRTRLDWIFVKQPSQWLGSYRFSPHFGETLDLLDKTLASPVSDHSPIVADLPLSPPHPPLPVPPEKP